MRSEHISPAAPAGDGAVATAKQVGLRYVGDNKPGISRQLSGQSFRYIDPDGKPLRNEAELVRIKSLAIPPAWTDVWISPWPNGHIQATGRDAKGRKQYRYHPRWRSVRDEVKYEHLQRCGRKEPCRPVRVSLQPAAFEANKRLAVLKLQAAY